MPQADPIRVLVIDDEQSLADSLAQILTMSGYGVASCYDGNSAIACAAAFRPDIVVSDYWMFPLNGIRTCTTIKALLPGCRIVILSAHTLPHDAEPPGTWGYLFLQKPIHPSELLAALHGEVIHPEGQQHLRVLNVDDIEAHRYSVSRLFQRAGFDVTEASTGQEALSRAVETQPDLILLDIHLPDRNGFEVCQSLRKHPATARITIIHVTSSATDEDSRTFSRRSGADDYLPYPIPPRKLVSRSRELLQMRFFRDGWK